MEFIKGRGGMECPIIEVNKPKEDGNGVWHNFELKDIDILKFGLIGAFKRISALEQRLGTNVEETEEEAKEADETFRNPGEPNHEPPKEEDSLPF